jgi:hypothetical protein
VGARWVVGVALLSLAPGCGEPCATPWFQDFDGDGYGDPDTLERACEPPEGFVPDARDCDDRDSGTHPDTFDGCNGVDDDCDGVVDPQGAVWYADGDGDGYGVTGSSIETCDEPVGFSSRPGDCDDQRPEAHPGALERCNGLDDDCDTDVDDGAPRDELWYADDDQDGFGDPYDARSLCRPRQTDSLVQLPGDCDDDNPNVNPAATERCNNGRDDDCNGLADDEEPGTVDGQEPRWLDLDHDDYGVGTVVLRCPGGSDHAEVAGDCDDGDASIRPGATETCDPGDEDCDGLAEEADPGLSGAGGAVVLYPDTDGDGFGAAAGVYRCGSGPGFTFTDDDCDDLDPWVGPDEWWFVDLDGDGAGAGALVSAGTCTPPLPGLPNRMRADCDDAAPDVRPTAPDACGDGLDADCTGYDRTCAAPPFGGVRVAAVSPASEPAVDPAVAVGDLDGDGAPDVVVVDGTEARVTFGPAPELPGPLEVDLVVPGAWAGAAAVWVGDRTDLVLADAGTGSLERFRLTGRSPVTVDLVVADLPAAFGASGLAPLVDGATPALHADPTWVALVSWRAAVATTRERWAWSGPGPVAGGGDPDQDGVVDAAAGEEATGRVLVWPLDAPGGVALDTVATTIVTGPPGAGFGGALAWVDWDGDAVLDLAVGAPTDDVNGVDAGAVYVFTGLSGAVDWSMATAVVVGPTTGDLFGTSLGVADVDGDGVAELLVGSPGSVVGNPGSGSVMVVGVGGTGIVDGLTGPAQWYGEQQVHLGARLWVADFDAVDGADLFVADDAAVWWLPGAP